MTPLRTRLIGEALKPNHKALSDDNQSLLVHRDGGQRSAIPQPKRAFNFDGTDDYLESSLTTGIQGTSGFAISCKVYKTTTGVTIFATRGGQSTLNSTCYRFLTWTANELQLDLVESTTNISTDKLSARTTNGIPANEWVTIACFWDGTTSVTGISFLAFKQDGTEIDLGANIDISIGTFSSLKNSSSLAFAKQSTSYYAFKMQDFRFYDGGETETNIRNLSLFGKLTGNETLLYKCDENAGTLAIDSSGNGNHGTLTNITASTFFYEGIDVPYSFQNDVGFQPFAYFNGVDGRVRLATADIVNFAIGSDWRISIDFIPISQPNPVQGIFGVTQSSLNDRLYIYLDSSRILKVAHHNGTSNDYELQSSALTNGTIYTIEVINTGGVITATANGVSLTSTTGLVAPNNINRAHIATDINGTSEFHECAIKNVTLYDSSDTIIKNYKASEGWDANVIADITSAYPIPRNESDTTKDVFGGELTFKGKNKDRIKIGQVNVGVFDGTDDSLEKDSIYGASTAPHDEFKAQMLVKFNSLVSFSNVFSTGSVFDTNFIELEPSGQLKYGGHRTTVGRYLQSGTNAVAADGTFYLIEVGNSSVNNESYIKVNGVTLATGNYLLTSSSTFGDLKIGNNSTLNAANITVSYFKIFSYDEATTYVEYTFNEGAGLTVYDLSGNDNHGTWTNVTNPNQWGKSDEAVDYLFQRETHFYKAFDRRITFSHTEIKFEGNSDTSLEVKVYFTGEYFVTGSTGNNDNVVFGSTGINRDRVRIAIAQGGTISIPFDSQLSYDTWYTIKIYSTAASTTINVDVNTITQAATGTLTAAQDFRFTSFGANAISGETDFDEADGVVMEYIHFIDTTLAIDRTISIGDLGYYEDGIALTKGYKTSSNDFPDKAFQRHFDELTAIIAALPTGYYIKVPKLEFNKYHSNEFDLNFQYYKSLPDVLPTDYMVGDVIDNIVLIDQADTGKEKKIIIANEDISANDRLLTYTRN